MPPKPPAKRKAAMESEPGPSAQKRPRKEGPTTNKRKLREGEIKVSSGLIFRREPSSQPSSSQNAHPPAPDASSEMSHSPPPPSKRQKTSPAPNNKVNGTAKGKERSLGVIGEEEERDREVADEVRAMENEDRDISRASSAYGGSHTDITMPLEPRETPRIEANRAMRGEPVAGPSTPKNRARRSSVGKGKRASMGGDSSVITTPHRSVEGKHFYSHIDPDQPDAARMSQLLQWTLKRQLSSDPPSGKDPPLTALYREVIEGTIRGLAEKKIDVSAGAGGGGQGERWIGKEFNANEQNEKNRARHARFTADIERAEAEDRAWIEADKFYDKLRASFDAEQEQRRQKGKHRADADVLPRVDLVPPPLQAGVQNILDVLAGPRELSPPDPRLAHARHMADSLHEDLSVGARLESAVDVELSIRFAELSLAMSVPQPPPPHYAIPTLAPPHTSTDDDPMRFLRALSVADQARPPESVDDNARRAAREAARARASGVGLGGGRGVREAPPPTPRKAGVGTPRPVTPGRKER
ncbi:hypothetical protein PENSPDRAFT_655942 [Peniophora sp. CONT]|nr:hypothetical protein PENSPDRAFT_655942 [Peniophora sp. CONT]